MTKTEKAASVFASGLAGILVGVFIILTGGPTWAALGFGTVSYYIFRFKDEWSLRK